MAPSRTSTVKNKFRVKSLSASTKTGLQKNTSEDGPKSWKSTNVKISKKPQKGITSRAILKKKRKIYSEKELGIPTLNMITPVGVQKPKNKKKGKIFVDDKETMMTIMSIVNAEKNGQIESKMMKARQLEEIREARRIEIEKKQDIKKAKLNDLKENMRKKRRKAPLTDESSSSKAEVGSKLRLKKRVSFA